MCRYVSSLAFYFAKKTPNDFIINGFELGTNTRTGSTDLFIVIWSGWCCASNSESTPIDDGPISFGARYKCIANEPIASGYVYNSRL